MKHEHFHHLIICDSIANTKFYHALLFVLVALHDCEDGLAWFENVDQFLEDLDHRSHAISANE